MAAPSSEPLPGLSPRRFLRPQSILFACSHNAVRSPMAEGLGRALFGRTVFFASAGVRAGELDPFAVAALREWGADLSRHHPQTFDDLDDTNFDAIISLSPEAHHRALEFTRTMAVDVKYWPTLDPTAIRGTRDTRMTAYRSVRDGLEARIRALLEGPAA